MRILADLGVRKGDEEAVKTLSQLGGTIGQYIRSNSSVISSVAAGIGTVSTAYLAAKASFKAAEVIRVMEEEHGTPIDRKLRVKTRTRLVWKLYIPTAVSTTSTILFIVGANRFANQKTVAAHAALAVTERAYAQYRDKVVEEFSKRKDQSIRDKVVDDHVKATAPSPEVMISGPGNVLCCEMYTGRYFTSDMEKLRKAQNDLNEQLLHEDRAPLSAFYELIGLKGTSVSWDLGWHTPKLMDLIFSATMTEDGRPCIAFDYNYVDPL